jgi:hypothetical protein
MRMLPVDLRFICMAGRKNIYRLKTMDFEHACVLYLVVCVELKRMRMTVFLNGLQLVPAALVLNIYIVKK